MLTPRDRSDPLFRRGDGVGAIRSWGSSVETARPCEQEDRDRPPVGEMWFGHAGLWDGAGEMGQLRSAKSVNNIGDIYSNRLGTDPNRSRLA
jgi:hypothetical protein